MLQINNVSGFKKVIFNLRVKIDVFFHFIPELLRGNISIKQFLKFLKRLLIFMSKMQHNKFVKIGDKTRIDLYVPGFPSNAFYTACEKFMTFGQKLPCATALISVTSACKYRCKHCYQRHDVGKDIDIEVLTDTTRKLQNMGIAFFNIEGGEPFLTYERLKKVCEVIDDRSEIWINSTGYGITKEKLIELKQLNVTAIMFSLHSAIPEEFNSFMGNDDAWDTMHKAIEVCHSVGISVAINTCLQRDAFYDGTFEMVMDKAKDLNTSIVQLIKPKAAGGWLETGVEEFSDKYIQELKLKVHLYNSDEKYKDYPSISAQVIEESKDVFGCTAGGTDRFYINAKGDLQPCEFLNISFGNIGVDDFDEIYNRMRKCFEKPGDCMICEKYSKRILEIYKENNLKSLPLDPALSQKVYEEWDRGEKTDLYERAEE